MVTISDLNPLIRVTRSPEELEHDLVVMEIQVEDLKTIFQRALNTWADCPPYILALSDKLEKL